MCGFLCLQNIVVINLVILYLNFWKLLNSMWGHTLKFGEISNDDYSAGERFKKKGNYRFLNNL
ncbi:hypothetical protein CBE85_07500 [Acinetobacter baumannii]|uniref:Uncharacterized protein n=1 Tax=Acinetobacter baumannii TaxID=470 RepID=A0A854NEG6_ACIBA|nr:hypothetical protein CBE85_07500 [Acinetobacter baumannii]